MLREASEVSLLHIHSRTSRLFTNMKTLHRVTPLRDKMMTKLFNSGLKASQHVALPS